jgi:hypothetical protein
MLHGHGIKGSTFRRISMLSSTCRCVQILRTRTRDRQYLPQANAILQRATKNGTNIYSGNWVGPAPSQFDMGGQISALSALTAAIGPPPKPSSSSASLPSRYIAFSRTLLFCSSCTAVQALLVRLRARRLNQLLPHFRLRLALDSALGSRSFLQVSASV